MAKTQKQAAARALVRDALELRGQLERVHRAIAKALDDDPREVGGMIEDMFEQVGDGSEIDNAALDHELDLWRQAKLESEEAFAELYDPDSGEFSIDEETYAEGHREIDDDFDEEENEEEIEQIFPPRRMAI